MESIARHPEGKVLGVFCAWTETNSIESIIRCAGTSSTASGTPSPCGGKAVQHPEGKALGVLCYGDGLSGLRLREAMTGVRLREAMTPLPVPRCEQPGTTSPGGGRRGGRGSFCRNDGLFRAQISSWRRSWSFRRHPRSSIRPRRRCPHRQACRCRRCTGSRRRRWWCSPRFSPRRCIPGSRSR